MPQTSRTLASSRSSSRSRHRVDVENEIIRKREKEMKHMETWGGQEKYYKLWEKNNAKHDEWTSPRYYDSNNKLVEKLKLQKDKEEKLVERRDKLRKLLEEEDKAYSVEVTVMKNHYVKSGPRDKVEDIPTELLQDINLGIQSGLMNQKVQNFCEEFFELNSEETKSFKEIKESTEKLKKIDFLKLSNNYQKVMSSKEEKMRKSKYFECEENDLRIEKMFAIEQLEESPGKREDKLKKKHKRRNHCATKCKRKTPKLDNIKPEIKILKNIKREEEEIQNHELLDPINIKEEEEPINSEAIRKTYQQNNNELEFRTIKPKLEIKKEDKSNPNLKSLQFLHTATSTITTPKWLKELKSQNLQKPKIWRAPKSPHNLIEEDLYENPWQLLVATIFLNKTSCMIARPHIALFLEDYPTPQQVLEARPEDLERYFVSIGLRKRATQVWRMSHDYLHKEWKNVGELYGIGKYGQDAYKMFCEGDFSVEPKDRFLRIYKAWYQMAGKQEEEAA